MAHKGIRPSRHPRRVRYGKGKRLRRKVIVNPHIRRRKYHAGIFRRLLGKQEPEFTLSNIKKSRSATEHSTKELWEEINKLKAIESNLIERQKQTPGFFERRRTKKLLYDPEKELVEYKQDLKTRIKKLEEQLPLEDFPPKLAVTYSRNKKKVLHSIKFMIDDIERKYNIRLSPNIYWDWQEIHSGVKQPIVIDEETAKNDPDKVIEEIREKLERMALKEREI